MRSGRNASNGSLGMPHASTSANTSQTASLQDLLNDLEDDMECPLCLEEIDLTDLHFKPCPCGYQICRFCWHHIKENLNGRCPACRTVYDDEAVRFKPMKADELKRLQAAKKQREKEKKETELLSISRKPLTNVRVKHKNQVHIRGLTARAANEDTLATLRNSENYGKFGRVSKIFLSRNASGPTGGFTHPNQQSVNLYINFARTQDAAACISAIDGTYTAEGNELRASWGTTKYCASFLRGQKCLLPDCQLAHELGEEVDINERSARQDLASMKHAMKESETKSGLSNGLKADAPGLPATASWASKNAAPGSQRPIAPQASSTHSPLPSPSVSTAGSSQQQVTSPPLLQAPIGRGQRLPRQPPSSTHVRQSLTRGRRDAAIKENGLHPQTMSRLSTGDGADDSAASSDTEIAGPVASTSSASLQQTVAEHSQTFEDADFALTSPPVASDFDRTLDTFASGSFSFSLRADVKGKDRAPTDSVLKASTRPSPLSMRAALDQIRPDNSPVPAAYSGAFDPFASPFDVLSPVEDERRTSRFGFAKRTATPVESTFTDTSSMSSRLTNVTRLSSPASSVKDDLSGAGPLWASTRSPPSAFSPEAVSSSAPLGHSRNTLSASLASRPLPPAGGSLQQLSLPPGLSGLSRSQGPMSTAAAYALPPPSGRSTSAGPPGLGARDGGSSDLYGLLGSQPPGLAGKGFHNPFSDPAVAHYGMGSADLASAAYHSLDGLRSPPPANVTAQPAYYGNRR